VFWAAGEAEKGTGPTSSQIADVSGSFQSHSHASAKEAVKVFGGSALSPSSPITITMNSAGVWGTIALEVAHQ
jgi:hypothetical protein